MGRFWVGRSVGWSVGGFSVGGLVDRWVNGCIRGSFTANSENEKAHCLFYDVGAVCAKSRTVRGLRLQSSEKQPYKFTASCCADVRCTRADACAGERIYLARMIPVSIAFLSVIAVDA